MALLHTLVHPARIQDLIFVEHPHASATSVLLVAAENKKVGAYIIPDSEESAPTLIAEFVGHLNR
jgi:protein MAK11